MRGLFGIVGGTPASRAAGAALALWVTGTLVAAFVIRAEPTLPHGHVAGYESVVAPGDLLTWTGPQGRVATMPAEGGAFPVWRHPYWVGNPLPAAVRVVDHPVSLAEAAWAAVQCAPWLHSAAMALVAGLAWRAGAVGPLCGVAGFLGLLRAGLPVWTTTSNPGRYLASASAIATGGWPEVEWAPGRPLLLAAVGASPDRPLPGRLLGVALATACVPLAARAAHRVGRPRPPFPPPCSPSSAPT